MNQPAVHADAGTSTSPAAVLYGAPEGIAPSGDYSVTINGTPVFVHTARASARPVGEWWPGHQRPLSETEITSFVHFALRDRCEIRVTFHHDILHKVTIKPERHGIEADILEQSRNEGVFAFSIAEPGTYICEIDTLHYPLYVIAHPPEEASPDRDDPNVLFFGPGYHDVGRIVLKENQHLHIAGGAVVHGYVEAVEADNLRISGHGILEASGIPRNEAPPDAPPHEQAFPRGPYLLHLQGCRNVRVEGISIMDAPFWTFVLTKCVHVRIEAVQVFGGWRYNSDGIDVVNCHDVAIRNSFIRAYDDCICIKGREETSGYPTGFANCEKIEATNCLLWNDWGVAIKIGTETMAAEMKEMRFENIDIPYFCEQPFAVQCGDFARIQDILVRDLRIGAAIDYHREPAFVVLRIYHRDERTRRFIRYYAGDRDCKQGETSIRNIRFEQIRLGAHAPLPIRLQGLAEEHRVEGISFRDLSFHRFPDLDPASLVEVNEYAEVPRFD